ncbi:NUDIX hydrolase [Nocardioides sp.]|jgi:8-oxo-dGTP pyrophosphatase MutT (NUDIX family)|uniref:NUDIX hydrolase n=1 Tax=Nocardioides sp. TaxID=35761 RepID=UPI002F3E6AFF
MPIPDFIVELREIVGHRHLWLPGVTAVVRRGEEILLVQRADNGAWTPVTGIPDPGEEPAAAAEREVLEETGVTARVDRLASSWAHGPITHANGDLATYLDLTFACTWVAGEPYVADDESSAVAWVRRDDLAAHGVGAEMWRRIDAALSDELAARFLR